MTDTRYLALIAAGVIATTALMGCQKAPQFALSKDCEATSFAILVDATSSQRNPDHLGDVSEAVAASAARAAVCDTTWTGRVINGTASEDIANAPELALLPGATENGRRANLAVKSDKIRAHFRDQLTTIIGATTGETSSLPTMFNTAAEFAEPDSEITLITDAVDTNDTVNLNAPLVPGAGAAAAQLVALNPGLAETHITIAGLGQVDAEIPPPSGQWVEEIRSYAETLCADTGASTCKIYTSWDQDKLSG